MSSAEQLRRLGERPWLVAVLALAILAAMAWGWQSVSVRRARLEHSVPRERALVRWMEQAAREVKTLRQSKSAQQGKDAGQSLLSVINATAASHSLAPRIRRMEPQGDDAVRLWLSAAPFDALVEWLGGLRQDYRIEVSNADINDTETPGSVDAALTLKRRGS